MYYKGFDLPDGLMYDHNHYWVKVEGDLIVMGMNDFAQKLAGQLVFVQLPREGKKLKKGKKFAKVESGKWLGKVYAPCNGVIHSCNENLASSPQLINEDCYGEGWMYKIEPNDTTDLNDLLKDPKDVQNWMDGEIDKHG